MKMKKYILSIIVFTAALFAGLPVFAEGSKDLYPNNASGGRAYLRASNDASLAFPFPNLGTHFVYAEAGERIALASNAQSGTNKRIYLYNPSGVEVTPTISSDDGNISNRTAELAGPRLPNQTSGNQQNRYTPIYYTVPAGGSGIYKVEFRGTNNNTTGDTRLPYSAATSWPSIGNNTYNYLIAWDISVAKQTGSNWAWVPGRVYTNVLNMDNPSYGGNNGNDNNNFRPNSGFYGKFNVLTRDGYVYNVDNNGSQGISFTFMVNNRGFHVENSPNIPSYKSIAAPTAAAAQNRYHDPNTADAEAAVTHKIFYNLPDNNMPIEATGGRPKAGETKTWLRPKQQNLNVTEMTLEGVDGTLSQISNKGGYIKFENNSGGDYTILIAPNINNPDYVATMNFVPRTLTGTSVPGVNNIYFDGKAGDGNMLPQGVIPIEITIKLRGAEVHFPYIDMELNHGGIIIELLKEDYSEVVSDKVYWDDSNIRTIDTSIYGSMTNPRNASHTAIPAGTSSKTNGHIWGTGKTRTTGTFGDEQGMDTWTFVEGDSHTQGFGVSHRIADLYVESVDIIDLPSDGSIRIGDEITYQVIAGNKEGSCPVEGAPFSFILPPGFVYEGDPANITFEASSSCGSEFSQVSYDPETGTFKSELNLAGSCDATGSGCTVTYTFKVRVTDQATSANTTATATIMRPNDVHDIDATNTSDPTNPLAPEGADVDLDAYYYPPTDPFFEVNNNGIEDNISNNIKNNQIPNFIDDIRADNDINQTPVDVQVSGNVLTNDYSSNGILNVGSAKYYDSSGEKRTLELGDPVEIYTENGEEAGTLILKSNGEYTFSPASGFVGDVPVEYTAVNGATTATSKNSDDARLTITVIPATLPGNNPPIALDDVATTKKGVTLTGDILANDSDPDGNDIIVTEIIVPTSGGSKSVTVPSTGVVTEDVYDGTTKIGTIEINKNGKFSFEPETDYTGKVPPIEYTISDGEGGTDKANIYITVIEDHGNTTFANDDANTAKKGVTMTGNVLDNDFDPEGNDQTLTKIKIGDNEYTPSGTAIVISGKGKLTINSNGKYTFEPEEDFVGTLVVEQTVCDNGTPVACDNATLYLTSLPESDNSTTAVDDFYETGNNTPITGNVMENDYDNEGDNQRVTSIGIITTDEGGTVIIDEEGNFTYTPPADRNGFFDTFTYTVCDNGTPQACDEAVVTIAVGICYEEVEGKEFKWNDSTGSGVVTETITQPAANYGFTFDIYELDNSFNMEVNGVKLAVYEIEFKSSGTSGINIEFADGNQYEVHTQGTGGKAIWQMKGSAANPLIRVVISPNGQVSMYGSKVNNGPLFPLRFKKEKGNKFNKINFSNAEDTTNEITVTQNIVGVTIMDGKGYGRNMVDCPNYWYGYNDNDWAENSNWTDNYVPKAYEDIVFATATNNSVVIQGVSGPGAGKGAADKDLHLDNVNQNFKDTTTPSGGRIIGDLINKSEKDLVVTTTNQLIIDGKVHGDNTGIIVVKADKDDATGTLIFNKPNDNKNVAAKVEFINLADECANCGFYKRQWQYFGIPVQGGAFPFQSLDGETVRRWDEPTNGDKWLDVTKITPVEDMFPFRGYEITSKVTAPKNYEFEGTLNVGDKEIKLSKTPSVNYSGMNLLSNSYTAAIPIELAAIELGSSLAENTVYLFNRGTRDQWRKTNGGSVPGTAGGQYTAVPVELAGQATLPDRILSMHSFMVNAASDGTQITLKYDELVKNETGTNQPAWRSANTNAKRELPYIVLDVIGDGSADRVWLFEESSTTRGYDNGWDGHKMLEGDLIQVFATDDDHNKYQVTTVPQLDNTTLGIAARENESYTISVAVADDVEVRRLYLHDLFTGRGYLLKNGAEFVISGTRSANQNRFKITSSPIAEAQKGDDAPIINTYVRDNVIVVENRSGENAIVSVYDISGRFVGKAQIAKDEIKSFAELSVGTGVKVVKVVSDSGSINRSNRVLLK